MTIQAAIDLVLEMQTDIATLTSILNTITIPQAATEMLGDIAEDNGTLLAGIQAIGLVVGAGRYPNTFVKDGLYRIVNTPTEQDEAERAGYVVATFPETMVKAGSPDIVVHNDSEKEDATDIGYALPGI
jgi:hypothetical protein